MKAYPKTIKFQIVPVAGGKVEKGEEIAKNRKHEWQIRQTDMSPNFKVEFLN